jgi:AraC-like DNA-binding protein
MEMAGQVVLWSHRMIGPDPAEARFLTEGIAAFVVRFLRAATGEPEARVHVVLPHRPIAPISVHEDSLQATVSFAPGDALEVRFDAALLDRRNRLRGDSGETPSALRSGALAESAELSDDQLLASLGHMVEATVMGARVNLAEAAHALGMSPRGLQRRLARLEMSFERIVDDWRHDQALQLLRDPSAGTSEVAYRLGYADPSHFIRAFRRWRGVSPMAFRRSLA